MQVTRRQIRESAFILIFESMFSDDSIDDIVELAQDVDEIFINDDVIALFKGVKGKTNELDNIIEKYSEKRTLARIPKVNIAIMRLALYEIIYDNKVPLNVAINEAVLLGKKFAMQPDVALINGILGSYSKEKQG